MGNRRLVLTVLLMMLSLAAIGISLGTASMKNESAAPKQAASERPGKLKEVPQMIQNAKGAGAEFERRELFQSTTKAVRDDAQLREVVSEGVILNLNKLSIQRILNENVGFLNLPLPDGKGGTVELELVKVNIFSAGFAVKTAEPTKEGFDESLGVHYRGIIKGNERSLVAISVFKNEVMGFFGSETDGNSVVGRLGGNNAADKHIIYAEKDLKANLDFECATEDTEVTLPASALREPDEVAALCIRIYVEADHDLFLNKGSVANVVSYLTGLFNQSATIFTNDSIPTSLQEIFVWNVPSPYAGINSSSALLAKFQEIRNSFNGDLGHLVALRGGGGIAAGFNAFCNTNIDNRQCFSGIDPTFSNVPTYSWSVSVFTHEMGHLMGSRHTHACVWNGNNTAIDGCSFPEGGCAQPGIPAGGGTIMSYCHQQGVGINFTLGFGTQPKNLIINRFNAATCFTDCNAIPCSYNLNPVGNTFTAAGGSNSFNVISPAACAWTTLVNAPSLLRMLPQENLLSLASDSNSRAAATGSATIVQSESSAELSPNVVFTNSTPITIPTSGTGTPYPSAIVASGLPATLPTTPGSIKVTINGLSHTFPDDFGIVLVGPTGAALNLQDGAGDGTDMVNVTYSLSDAGAAQLPNNGAWAAGTYKPTAYYADVYPAPGPASYQNPGPINGGTATFASTFGGTNPNGTWSLYVVDFVGGDSGSISGGWSLEITGGTPSWINITSGSSGSGNGMVSYTVAPYSGSGQRIGTITVNSAMPSVTHTVTQNGGTPPPNRARADFDADGKSDVSVWRPSNGFWYIHHSSNINSYDFQPFGSNGDRIAPGDYDNDGRCDLAVFRPSNGTWYLQRSTLGFTGQQFGTNGDIPAAGDYDGDGRTDIAVWRPTNGTFYIINSSTGALRVEPFGSNGDKPVVGDYDGDGRADPAVFRPSNGTWYQLRSTLGFTGVQFGLSTDLPAQGDFDGDGRTDPAVFRPSNGTWYLLRSTLGFTGQQFGSNGDRPAPGDFDGDAKTDLAVFRPSNGTWYMILSATNTFRAEAFGTNGDVPITAGYIPQ